MLCVLQETRARSPTLFNILLVSLPSFPFPSQESLHSLMSTLGQANPYFIRCIKPNSEKAPNYFMPDMVLNQLKYSGKYTSKTF